MAASATRVKELAVPGDLWYTINDIALDNKYASGGEALTLQALGFGPEAVFSHAVCQIKAVGGTVNVASAYYDGSKLHLWDETPADVANDADVSNIVVRIKCYCSSP